MDDKHRLLTALLALFDEAAQRHGWEADQGRRKDAEEAKATYDASKSALDAAIGTLLTERDGLLAQHHRDGTELRSLCAARDEARKQRDALREALNVICQWQPPEVLSQGELVPMSVAIGSNGERDWFRDIARAALTQ